MIGQKPMQLSDWKVTLTLDWLLKMAIIPKTNSATCNA